MESNRQIKKSWFDITPLITPILIITITLFSYNFILAQELFPAWVKIIGYVVKIIIAYEILTTAPRTLWAPIIAISIGVISITYYPLLNITSAWAIIIVSLIGFLIAWLTRSKN